MGAVTIRVAPCPQCALTRSSPRQLELSYLAFSVILLCKGVSVGVVYTGNNIISKSEVP